MQNNSTFISSHILLLAKACLLIILIGFNSCATNKKQGHDTESISAYREKYKASFIEDQRSPLNKDEIKDLDFYDEDQSWKLNCSCTPVKEAVPFEMPLYSGITRTYKVHSILTCNHNGQQFTMQIYQNATKPANPMYSNYLFLPFKDDTNGEETYGGGRYIDLKVSDIVHNQVTIDFNKSYNPWCAFSAGYNCPIPPVENHLPFEVRAGEKMYKGQYKEKIKE